MLPDNYAVLLSSMQFPILLGDYSTSSLSTHPHLLPHWGDWGKQEVIDSRHHCHAAAPNNIQDWFPTCWPSLSRKADSACALDLVLLRKDSPPSSLPSLFISHFLCLTPTSLQTYRYFSHFKQQQWQQTSLKFHPMSSFPFAETSSKNYPPHS